jgi:hypothetical protein
MNAEDRGRAKNRGVRPPGPKRRTILAVLLFAWIAEATMCADRGF